MMEKRSIFTFCICFVLFASLLFGNIILAQDGGSYDPWMDLNDDGIIDAQDLQLLALIYSTSGTPINKTELLLLLEARIDSLNTTLLTDYYNITECDVIFVDASGDIIMGHLGIIGDLNVTGYLNGDLGTLYVDDVNHRVGIGTIGPTCKLDVAGNIQGETLGVDQIRLGSSEGNRYIYIYEDGSPTGAYIWWYNIGDRFIISDDIEVQGKITISTTTRYYSIPASAWYPDSSYTTYFSSGSETYTPSTLPTTYWYAPVHLPHGAEVTELKVRIYDIDITEYVDVALWRGFGGTSYSMGSVISTGSSGWNAYVDNSIDYATIDNQHYVYFLKAGMRTGNSDHRLGQVWITYTVDETLP